jgi:aconitate decarboxylase
MRWCNETVKALREKVFVTSDEEVKDHKYFIAVKFANGKKIEAHIEHAISSYEKPLDMEFLKNKFTEQVGKGVGKWRAQKAYTALAGVAKVTDVALLACSCKA